MMVMEERKGGIHEFEMLPDTIFLDQVLCILLLAVLK